MFFIQKYIKIIFFFKKIIFDISDLKIPKNIKIKKKIIFFKIFLKMILKC